MPPQPIHILGVGNIGKLFAHSLRKSHPNTPITLLFRHPSLVNEWRKGGQCIEITRNGKPNMQSGFGCETTYDGKGEIRNLIVATKSYATRQAMLPFKDRLKPSSTILFLQNGVGTIDEVTLSLFDQTSLRPFLLAGIVNHGVYKTGQFSAEHIGIANMVMGSALANSNEDSSGLFQKSAAFLCRQILECPELITSLVSPQELLQTQLQKLSVNAVINPLSVIFDCFNGELFYNASIRSLIKALVFETSTVLRGILTSQNSIMDPVVKSRFSGNSLENHIQEIATKTAGNSSSMRQDMHAGRKTEIDYINGYIIAQGLALGIKCPLNLKLVQLVKEKKSVNESEIHDVFGIP